MPLNGAGIDQRVFGDAKRRSPNFTNMKILSSTSRQDFSLDNLPEACTMFEPSDADQCMLIRKLDFLRIELQEEGHHEKQDQLARLPFFDPKNTLTSPHASLCYQILVEVCKSRTLWVAQATSSPIYKD